METTTSDARAVNGKRHGLDLFMVAMEVCGEPEYRLRQEHSPCFFILLK